MDHLALVRTSRLLSSWNHLLSIRLFLEDPDKNRNRIDQQKRLERIRFGCIIGNLAVKNAMAIE